MLASGRRAYRHRTAQRAQTVWRIEVNDQHANAPSRALQLNRPSILSDVASSTVSTQASPTSRATGVG